MKKNWSKELSCYKDGILGWYVNGQRILSFAMFFVPMFMLMGQAIPTLVSKYRKRKPKHRWNRSSKQMTYFSILRGKFWTAEASIKH